MKQTVEEAARENWRDEFRSRCRMAVKAISLDKR